MFFRGLLAALAGHALQAAPSVNLQNSGFEAPYVALPAFSQDASGEVAQGWSARPGGPSRFARESSPEAVRAGGSSQRVELLKFTGKQTEIVQRLSLTKGERYRVTVWLRASDFFNVQLSVRNSAPPYAVAWTRKVRTATEWEAHELTGTATADDAALVIATHAAGTIWIDEARIERIDGSSASGHAAPAAPAAGNLLPNSSFEAGVAGGWSVLIRTGGELADSTLRDHSASGHAPDPSTFTHGARSLRIPLDRGLAAIVSSPLVRARPGERYTASIDLRAAAPSKVRVTLLGADGRESLKTVNPVIGPGWQRVAVTAEAPASGVLRLQIGCGADAPLELWLDAAQLEAGSAASAYVAPYPLELALSIPRPGAIVFDGESAPVEARAASAAGPLPPGARLRMETETLATEPGTPNPRPTLPATPLPAAISGLSVASLEVAADSARPRGMFKLRGVLIDENGHALSAPVETTFARIPRPSDTPAEDSFFGIHATLRPDSIAIARALGNRWLRLHDASAATKWTAVEPRENDFRFVDDGIDAARASGLSILGMLCGAPPWASVKPRATSGYWATYNYPDREDGAALWSRYVSRTVSHYRGRIDDWEVWNEPWSDGFFKGTAAQYGRLLGLASEAARAANPSARILGFGAAAHKLAWTAEALAATPSDAFDVFSFHDYNASFYGGAESNAVRLANRFTEVQRPHGEPRPLWDTECGPGHVASWHALPGVSGKGLSPRAQMAHIVRFEVTQLSAGVRRSFYYTLHNPPPSGESAYQAVEHDGAIRPVMAARAVLASLVDGARWLERIEPAPGLEGHVFERKDGERVTVLWSLGGDTTPAPFSPPAGGRVLDIVGNLLAARPLVVSSTPIYLVTPL